MDVVMNRCPKIEYARLFGELGLHGFNSGVISSKRAKPMNPNAPPADPNAAPKPVFDGFDTRAIHAGTRPCPATGARSMPL